MDDLIYELMTDIRRLTRSSLMMQQVIASKMELNVTDAECIDFLKEMGPSTAGDLARATRLTTGAITSVIDRLEKAGYVERDRDPDDRRKVIVKVVGSKQAPQKDYASMAMDVFNFLKAYKEDELNLLKEYTRTLTGIFQDHAGKGQSETNQ